MCRVAIERWGAVPAWSGPLKIPTPYPHFQRLMLSSNDGVGQIIKTFVTVVTCRALTSWFRVIKATRKNLLRLTRGTHNAVGPAQRTNRLITLHLVDEILDVDLHGRTPVRDRGMGCRQYTPSSHATTLESNKSVRDMRGAEGEPFLQGADEQ
jgi:hypothetical protein